jgi:hypothetical protein
MIAFHEFQEALEDWIKRTQTWCIRALAFLAAVAPVLLVSGWFYVSGN